MTPEAQRLLETLEQEYTRAAFYANNYIQYNLGTIAKQQLSLPSDNWNSGNNHRIEIPKNAKIRLITAEDTYQLRIGGVDTDKIQGLWVSAFTYNR